MIGLTGGTPLPAQYPTDRITMAFTLSTDDDAMRFVRASEDIEADLPGTSVRIISFSDIQPDVALPPNSKQTGGPWLLVGIIVGPRAEEIPDSNKPALNTEWSRKVLEILQEHGLEETKDVIQ
jgi:hypothetical protein